MKKSEVAEAARDLIEEYGWVRGMFGNKAVGFCLLGAIRVAARTNVWSARELCASVISRPEYVGRTNLSIASVSTLNDFGLNDKEEAIEVLTQVAKYWRDQGE